MSRSLDEGSDAAGGQSATGKQQSAKMQLFGTIKQPDSTITQFNDSTPATPPSTFY
ncbi:MAG: hypothetical protein LC649_06215 [Bacteroidales bacterium]|nr:hypothetical protein [Bacteroidales bacterium]